MNPEIPEYVSIIFILTTLYTIWLFKRAFKPNQITLVILYVWLGLQGFLANSGFYQDTTSLPPKFGLALIPTLILIAYIFLSPKGKKFMDKLDPESLYWIHTVRIPIEIVLWMLFVASQIPEAMTFRGRNFDIIAGLTAPLIIFYGIRKPIIDKNRLLLWNVLCLFLLLNIVVMAILSIDSPLQTMSFEMPNKGIIQFPYVWLASFIVPTVLFSHLVSIRHLLKK
ncbi:hypothetical protein [Arcticibacterium luteifluviistationis]|uniref:Uncharacterized protein n=1 Tax=Arcticibacterium luteifluviistationis TaxID=1784714 RepID=A0A2Z4G6Q7_9BACT|nr:hypothetical protein [Arcticibacterium luteifluviistationis]AWV96832.1 hypothetical protein DJ013_00985 [Arcticibacterium luteifluviistationis]